MIAPERTVPATKVCRKCGAEKGADCFYRDARYRDGLGSYCKNCVCPNRGAVAAKREDQERLAALGQKRCAACGDAKSLGDFWASDRGISGRQSWCKECLNAQAAERVAREKVAVDRKACSACGEAKPAADFTRRASSRDGLSGQCKECQYRRRAERLATPEGLERARRTGRLSARRRAEQIREYQREWLEANREWRREYKARWRRENPEKQAAQDHRRRTASRGEITAEEWAAMLDFYDRTCLCCGSQDRISLDHVVPLSLGGPNLIGNAQPLCISCNCRKHAAVKDYRDPFLHAEFMAALEGGG